MKRIACFSVLWIAFFNFVIVGQTDRKLERQIQSEKTESRIALVIGNGAYTKAKPLQNPSNDAKDVAKTLSELGFEVISGADQNKRQMENLIREFGTKLAASGGVGLFYYAGHGVQVAGENYLIPIDADIPEEDEVTYAAVPISLVLGKIAMAKNDLNIVILDACRNNPFARSWRSYRDNSNQDGLAKISPPTGTLVLYATEPGKVASDGKGRNGLFTEAILKHIKDPNLEYDQLVKAVSADVWQKSNKQQLPWKEGNTLQDFYFVKDRSSVAVKKIDSIKVLKVETNETANTNESKLPASAEVETLREVRAWNAVKNSSEIDDLRFFLKEFPNGANAENAKVRLEELSWQLVKDSNDKIKIQAFIDEFPDGANAFAAKNRLRKLDTVIDLAGTIWTCADYTIVEGVTWEIKYTSKFLAKGESNFEFVSMKKKGDSKEIKKVKLTPGIRTWEISGDIIRLTYKGQDNSSSSATGTVSGDQMQGVGKASNGNESTWVCKKIS